MRLKIIIIVFVIVVIFYIFQFVYGYMNKKEHFTSAYYDDAEHYEDSPNKTDQQPYELRIFILDEIDKLNITDKNLKGNVMESLFSESSMKELEGMTKEQRVQKIKNVSQSAANNSKGVLQETSIVKPIVVAPIKTVTPVKAEFTEPEIDKNLDHHLKDMFNTSSVKLPGIKDYYDNKENLINDKLTTAINALSELKNSISNNKKEQYIPELPKPPIMTHHEDIVKEKTLPEPDVSKTKAEVDVLSKPKSLIEGFENIYNYAPY